MKISVNQTKKDVFSLTVDDTVLTLDQGQMKKLLMQLLTNKITDKIKGGMFDITCRPDIIKPLREKHFEAGRDNRDIGFWQSVRPINCSPCPGAQCLQ